MAFLSPFYILWQSSIQKPSIQLFNVLSSPGHHSGFVVAFDIFLPVWKLSVSSNWLLLTESYALSSSTTSIYWWDIIIQKVGWVITEHFCKVDIITPGDANATRRVKFHCFCMWANAADTEVAKHFCSSGNEQPSRMKKKISIII